MDLRRALEAGLWAAALSGAPSTVHALAAGDDPLEASLAAGSVLLPHETRIPRVRALPLVPQVADHVAYGVIVGLLLDRRGHD